MQDYVIGKARPDEPEVEQPQAAGIVPKVHFRWMFTGPSTSGKTNLARWSLDHYYVKKNGKKGSFFDRIYLLSPTANIDPTWSDLPGLADKDRHSKPTAATLAKIFRDQQMAIQGSTSDVPPRVAPGVLNERKRKAPKILVICDDAIAESKLINSDEFMKMYIQGRHFNISSMVMAQSYMKVPRVARLQATHVSMFPSKSTEIPRLYAEHGPKEISKREFEELVMTATHQTDEEKYPFLYVDVNAPINERFRRNFTHAIPVTAAPQQAKAGQKRQRQVEESTEGGKRLKTL